jgi:hypothetical protein
MGVEYRHYLLPHDRRFHPDSTQLMELIEAMRAQRWLPTPQVQPDRGDGTFMTPECPDRRGQALPQHLTRDWLDEVMRQDLALRWPVKSTRRYDLRYPLQPLPDLDGGDTYYDVWFELSSDYVYRVSDCIDPFETTACPCGTGLEFEVEHDFIWPFRLRSECPACRRPFDPSGLRAAVRNMWTNDERVVPGGATSRFAIVVDCGKAWPRSEDTTADHEFVALCARVLACTIDQMGDAY